MKRRKGYLYSRNGTFYLQYDMRGKRFKECLYTDDPAEAEEMRRNIMAPLALADEQRQLVSMRVRMEDLKSRVEKARRMVRCQDAWRKYLMTTTRPDSGPATLAAYETHLRQFLEWLPGKVKHLDDISPEIASKYASVLAQRVAPNTFNRHMQGLNLIMKTLLGVSPFAGVAYRRPDPEGKRALSVAELEGVLSTADGDLRRLITLGAYTGMRFGDCCLLKWSEVDWDHKLIRRIPLKMRKRKKRPVLIPLHKELEGLLVELRGKDKTDRPEASPYRGKAMGRGGYVLPVMAREYLKCRSTLNKRVRGVFRDAGLQTDEKVAGYARRRSVVGFHSLRHTFVSMCRGAGVPLAVVEQIVGHHSPAMTQYYTHVGDDNMKQAIDGLPSFG